MGEKKDDLDVSGWATAERLIDKEMIENWKKFGAAYPLPDLSKVVRCEIHLPPKKPWWKFW